jgi:hypothetical protein
MPEEGIAEPDPVLGPEDLPPGYAVEEAGDEAPAPAGWRGAVVDRVGLASSVLIHLCLVLWVVGWLSAAGKPVEDDVISVTLVEEKKAEEPPAPAPPKTPPESAETPPPENADRATEPPQSPKAPDETPPQPAETQPASPRPAEAESAPPSSGQPEWSDVLASLGMAADSRPTTLTREDLDGVRAQAKSCWTIPAGWSEPRQVTVTIRFQLNRDGTLKGSPSVVAFPASELGKTAALNAMRAVADCAPFKLPPEKYAEWSDIQLRFEP